jgi:hypothetical protein
MSTKDGLLAAGVALAFVLSAIAFMTRPGSDAVPLETSLPPETADVPAVEVPAGAEDQLASVEARMRRIEDAVGRLEKRIEDAADSVARKAVEHRGAERRPRPPEHAAVAVDPRAAEPLGLDELRRMGIDIPDLPAMRGVRLGGGESPAKELAREFDLTEDQRERVGEILEEFKGTVDEKLPAPGRPAEGVRVTGGADTTNTLRKLQAKLVKKLAKVLDKEQREKLGRLVAKRGLPIAGANTVWRFRETPGGGVAVTSTSVRSSTNNVRIETRTGDAVTPAPPPAGGVGDPDGVF